MQRLFFMTLVLFFTACAHRSIDESNDTRSVNSAVSENTETSLPSYPDIPSFRVSDVNGDGVVDQELEVIPTEVNPMVEKWISYFQGRGRPHMERYLARSTRYEKLMKKVLRENGLPEDLFYIALIESGFSARATSHAAAVGYWQFIRGTGRRYGLEMNKFVDERRDPVLATQAAAEYFKGLYSVFGSWYLAMASYNVGENRVKKIVMKYYTRDFWELARKKSLPKETVNYVPKFIAAKMIAKNPAKYGFDGIDYMPPIEYDHVVLSTAVNLREMAEKMNVNYEDFKALNPKFKGEIAPLKNGKELSLRIPPGAKDIAIAASRESKVEKLEFVADSGDTQNYRIKRGDTLSTIAQRYRTTIAYLRDLNEIPKGKILRVGARIQVPDRTPIRSKRIASHSSSKNSRTPSSKQSNRHYHVVQNGDSLIRIAKKYSVTVNDLRKVNNLEGGRIIRTGARLRLPENTSEN